MIEPRPNEEKLVPLDTTGESVDVELKDEKEEKVQKNDSEISVEQTEEKPVETQTEEKSEEHDKYSSKVQVRINDLTKKWREAERQSEAALQYAKSVKEENENLKKKNSTLDASYIEEYKTRAQAETQALQKQLADAIQSGDSVKQAEIQEKLTSSILQKQRAEMTIAKRAQDEEEKTNEKPAEAPIPDQKPIPKPEPSQKAKDWASRNTWFGDGTDDNHDVVKTMATYGIHRQLITEGVDPESNDYYNEIDTRLSRYFSDNVESNQVSSNRPAQTVAGAARNGKATGRKTVKLSPTQVTLAKKLGVPLEEYARQLQLMQQKS